MYVSPNEYKIEILKMNLAIFKIGARINDNESMGNSSNEVLATIRLLEGGGNKVTAFTRILKKDNPNPSFNIRNYEEFPDLRNEFDAVVIVNGAINFFGGQEDADQLWAYRVMSKYKGPIFYFLYDPYLGLKQCARSVVKRPWGHKYKESNITVPENKLHYITQCKSTNLINEQCQKTCTYFPLEKFPLLMEKEVYNIDFDSCQYDLNYAGTFRGGRRKSSMLEYYFGLPSDIKVQMFGNLKLDQFKLSEDEYETYPEFGKPVTHDKVKENIQLGKSTVIIGDKLYIKLNDIAQRFYESIIYGQVTFMDAHYDKENRMYKNPKLSKLLRVSNKQELIEKLRKIKDSKELFDKITEAQRKDILLDFDKSEYCLNLTKIMENFI